MVDIELVKKLRQETQASLQDCKKALEESQGDVEKAKELLKEWGKEIAAKKTERETKEGIIASYIHSNKKIGVLVQLECETDFVAKSQEFQDLANELTLQVAAMPAEISLEEFLKQPWIKDPNKKIEDLIQEYIAKIGENIVLRRFVKFEI